MSPIPSRAADAAGRVRPPDRRDHLVAAATDAFSEHGFHGTKLSQIADAAGVSTPALYRHFDNKSDLLGAVTRTMSLRTQATLVAVEPRPDDPAGELAALIDAHLANVLAHRNHSDIYRWEWRSLEPAERSFAREIRRDAHRRVRGLVRALRPELTKTEADTLTDAIYAVAGSPASHRVSLPRKAIIPLIGAAARTAGAAELPAAADSGTEPSPGLAPTGKRETILTESVALFAERGFHEVTIDEIGAASGLPPSGVYRHFGSKQAILCAALQRASERTTSAIASGLAQTSSRDDALVCLVEQYARLCVGDPAIITVYQRCLGALPDDQRADLRRQQRINVDEWSTWLIDARPELSTAAARFLVHAALEVMADLTASPHAADAPTVTAIALAVLLKTPVD